MMCSKCSIDSQICESTTFDTFPCFLLQPQEFETKVQVIRKTPQMKTVERTEMVKKLEHEEKTTTVPRTKVIHEEKTRTITKPVVREVSKTRKVDVHR